MDGLRGCYTTAGFLTPRFGMSSMKCMSLRYSDHITLLGKVPSLILLQIPPFNDQENVQAISSDIAVLLKDWVDEARRPQTSLSRTDIPVDLIDRTISKYLEELRPDRRETKCVFEDVQRQLRRYW